MASSTTSVNGRARGATMTGIVQTFPQNRGALWHGGLLYHWTDSTTWPWVEAEGKTIFSELLRLDTRVKFHKRDVGA